MNSFSANSECANSSLTDVMLRHLSGSGTLYALMDVVVAEDVVDIIITPEDVRLYYAVEIGTQSIA